MADLTITAANVALGGTGVSFEKVQVGEAITQGEPVYKLASDSKYYLADADAEATAEAKGMALTPAAADGYILIQKSGSYNPGATVTVGETYCVSTNAGGVAPIGDLTTGDYVTILGTATATDAILLKISISGTAKP
jgi:hypothetical protein